MPPKPLRSTDKSSTWLFHSSDKCTYADLPPAREAGANEKKRFRHDRQTTKSARHVLERRPKSKSSVTIFLVNGVKLQGNITWFDNFCVLLRRDGQAQLVYKHAISTVMPLGPIQLQDTETAALETA